MLRADINYGDNCVDSKLHFTCSGRDHAVTKLLLQKGARNALRDDGGQTALDLAKMQCKSLLVDIFKKF